MYYIVLNYIMRHATMYCQVVYAFNISNVNATYIKRLRDATKKATLFINQTISDESKLKSF